MRVAFYHSDKPRECDLAEHFGEGVRAGGDHFEARPTGPNIKVGKAELVVMVGVKSTAIWRAARDQGARTLMLDKGYSRHRAGGRVWEYWRTSLDAHQPTCATLDRKMPLDRLDALGWVPAEWREPDRDKPILIAGSSAKYHTFMGLGDPTEYNGRLIAEIRKFSRRRIIYRPKPSWRDARAIRGARYSPPHEQLGQLLETAHCLVTHGSNACLDAMMAGVPSIILGEAVMAPISSRSIAEIEAPRLARMNERRQLLGNLAYHQWTEAEMASGEAWGVIKGWI